MNHRKRRPNYLYPLILVSGMIVALLVSMGIIIINLNPPSKDLQLLSLFMMASGSGSIFLVYMFYRLGILERINSLRWTLLVNIVFLVVLIFLNVWLTAQLMFISYHDFILTIALLLFAGLVSALCMFFIANVWIDRIYDLGQAAQQLSGGDLQTRLEVRGHDEISQLTAAFNQMVDGLEAIDAQKRQLEQTRRDLVAWVSHDLRTPLAAIRAMNEAILDGVVTDHATVRRYIENVQSELFHLSKMIDDLFELAKLDTGNFTISREPASLRDLISDTLGSLNAKAAQAGVQLSGELETGLDIIQMAPDKMQRVLYNLLDNALRHTPAGGRVFIRAQCLEQAVKVTVHNSDSVIPPGELDKVFESFYRGEPSRAQDGGHRGTGLGLAIVRGFIEAHGGQIKVESDTAQGTTFAFTIPIL